MHEPIAYQREKGVEFRTLVIAALSVTMMIANIVSIF